MFLLKTLRFNLFDQVLLPLLQQECVVNLTSRPSVIPNAQHHSILPTVQSNHAPPTTSRPRSIEVQLPHIAQRNQWLLRFIKTQQIARVILTTHKVSSLIHASNIPLELAPSKLLRLAATITISWHIQSMSRDSIKDGILKLNITFWTMVHSEDSSHQSSTQFNSSQRSIDMKSSCPQAHTLNSSPKTFCLLSEV